MKEIERRDALQAVAGLVSAAAVGTAAGRFSSAPLVGSTTGAPDAVPATADALAYANVDVLRRDAGMKTLTDAALHQRAAFASPDDPGNVDALLADIEANWNTDPRKLHRVTAFGDVGGSGDLLGGYGGVVLNAELTAEDVKNGFENLDDVEFEELTSSGTVVYEPDEDGGPWVGALESDRVVVGTEDAVADAVDVANGEASAIGGALREAYADSRDAPVRFAARMPSPSDDDAVPASVGGAGGRAIDLTPMDAVTTLRGAVYGDGDTRGLTATLSATDAGAARDVAAVVSELRDRLEHELGDAQLAGVVGDVSVERDGAAVTSSVEKTRSELQSLAGDDTTGY